MAINKNPNIILLLISLLLPSILQRIHAVEYTVTNNVPTTPGGIRFDREIGVPYTVQQMNTITNFIWNLFEEHSPSERKSISAVKVFISDFDDEVGNTIGDTINISAPALQKYPKPGPEQARFFFTSVMYHEMTHVFQWTGNEAAPNGLIEGMAEYVKVKANYIFPNPYVEPGSGQKWDEGYGVTERFLEYCDSLKKGFTVQLNKKMRYAYSDNYFKELLGKSVDQLWADYKAKYGNKAASKTVMLPNLKY